jgi:hypothetical protein
MRKSKNSGYRKEQSIVNTTTEKTSDTVLGHLENCKECLGKATSLLWLMVILALIASLVEIFIYMPIITSKLYNSDPMANNLIAAILSAAPVLLACVAALVIDRMRISDKGKALLLIVFLLILAFEIAYFYWAWNLRTEVIDDELLSNVLNLVAIMVAAGTFIAHIIWSKERALFLSKANIYKLHADYNKTQRGLAPFEHTAAIDMTRRSQCFNDLVSAFKTIVENVIQNVTLSRLACAKLFAKSDAQTRAVAELPLKVNGQMYNSPREARDAIGIYIGVPSPADYHKIFGAETNGPLDRLAREAASAFKAHYNQIVQSHPGIDL